MAPSTPAGQLPPAVISEILSRLGLPIASTGEDIENNPSSDRSVPWKVAVINRAWRECALRAPPFGRTSNPSNSVYSFTDKNNVSQRPQDATMAGHWRKILKGSSEVKLKFEAIEGMQVPSPVGSNAAELIDGKLSSLRRLEIVCDKYFKAESPLPRFTAVLNLREPLARFIPSLETDHPFPRLFHLPRGVSRPATNLVELSLRIIQDDWGVPSPGVFPHLTRLSVHDSLMSLKALKAPSVRELTCVDIFPTTLHSLCKRSKIFSSLRSLTLIKFTHTQAQDSLVEILLDLTGLEELFIRDGDEKHIKNHGQRETALFKLLHGKPAPDTKSKSRTSRSKSQRIPCPKLQSFVFYCLIASSNSMEPFFDMRPTLCALLLLGLPPFPSSASYTAEVAELQKLGVDIEVAEHYPGDVGNLDDLWFREDFDSDWD
ncbi:hypothetical protein R3P38DRAFT_3203864 [Favolaschia claudopus]|uniref:F-box domain-containing protein n=1 Tax=Favolaschia claudopus TaxID=2862362 RepID=A0AAW0AU01_9AGAR